MQFRDYLFERSELDGINAVLNQPPEPDEEEDDAVVIDPTPLEGETGE